MHLKLNTTMAKAIEQQLVVDPQSRFLEMKSLQPYSTTDEYLYAMKEDLAEWLSNMYPEWSPITADNFLECLENGVLLCQHANNVNEAARKILPSSTLLTNCKYRANVRPQTFNARDNVSQFIKWSRHIACVREVLMFESDDLILRKNEKNFILCLLEIARFGAKFGVSVPAIIKLEDEIEREIERDKQEELLSNDENSKLFDKENEIDLHMIDDNISFNSINEDVHHQITFSTNNTTNSMAESLSNSPSTVDSNKNNPNGNSKRRNNSEESYDSTASSEITTTMTTPDHETSYRQVNGKRNDPIVPPASSSFLHKTVVKIVNSCCCSQRFPVIRIGEGKYRIGEHGAIIFIRILRNHVMVRVGGGWDTLENYLNKHDPCRRTGHRQTDQHDHHSDIPILALSNPNVSPSVQKNSPFGKSVTIKTEEFPLPKPSNHDANLVDAQLVITRGADGRHRIGQITYRAEEDTLNPTSICPHHQHQTQSPPTMKTRTSRTTGRFTPSAIYNKQSSPSTDQDYSSLTETTPSKPSSSSSLDFKEESSIEQAFCSVPTTLNESQTVRSSSPIIKLQNESPASTSPTEDVIVEPTKRLYEQSSPIRNKPLGITESIIETIDGHIPRMSLETTSDFNISDIEEIMGVKSKQRPNDDTNNIDNDSLESSEGVLEEKKAPSLPVVSLASSTRKSSGYCSAFYLAQKQKFQQEQAAHRKRAAASLNRFSTRSNTLPNVVEAVKKEEQAIRQRRKPTLTTKRSQSIELSEKATDISRVDRDSGFDEQDFRRERLQSIGDDNSSMSSMKSPRSSTASSINIEYKENKAYELRMKKLEVKRNSTDKDTPVKGGRNSSSSARRTNDPTHPVSTTNKYRKNSQPIIYSKQQQNA